MSTATQTKREIDKKTARVAYLTQTVRENLPFVTQRFADGFFTACSERFTDFARDCDEITKLHGEIMQLSFDLERIEAEQTELSLSPVS